MKPAKFAYHRPDRATDAVALLGKLGENAKVLAGGQSLVPLLSLRLAYFDHLVDISRLPELQGVRRTGDAVRVGAGTTEAAVGRDDNLRTSVPLLSRVTPFIGHFQIRNRGTVGGSLAHADPAAEYPAVAVALDAEFDVLSLADERTIPASEFFTGLWSTALEPGELLVAVRFPVWSGRCGFAVEEFARRHGDFAIAGAVLGVQVAEDGRVRRCAIGLMGMGSTPKRARQAEHSATGVLLSEVDPRELGELAASGWDDTPSDLQGTADYRRKVCASMVARAWGRATEEATHG
ncbi:FAD binding domain-containing protein [Amycolatopsis sp. RTGN1]|uniref:FAD binding domain-containing protein n=1 Tax=Amycolatopsis ponsaeliensis TaxID=2992142 RepID=UPI002550CD20|nr:xanthine dehydrogenase family protein subunit M [Amycolatopsis sp. RTGN1]